MSQMQSSRIKTLVLLIAAAWVHAPSHAQISPAAKPFSIDSQQKEKLLKLVEAPDPFEVQLFTVPPEINYPACITAAPNGDLFVGIDRNGSLDTERGRGQIYRVMDSDNDGQGDHYTVFVDSVDSPRGVVYDGHTLYVMHPPNLTAYRDTDGDGVADESKRLVRGLGRSLDFRGADHTTNGLQMGIDGWLYIAVGDYGFDDAVGADGTHIRYRGGAVVRVRPDGSELEIYATGTRNTYDITLDPYLNGFVRGNTNDGQGWDVRLNQILPLANYGYPSLFTNFPEETMPPLADYGGGSGTGALYVDTPDLPEPYGETLYTTDWGLSQVFRHPLRPEGAQFEAEQEEFLQIPQPTDMTIDGQSNLYVSSWYGATFTNAGADVGFIARVSPKRQTSGEVPEFREASHDRLVSLSTSPRHQYRMHAQREILRRGSSVDITEALKDVANSNEPVDVRAAAIFTLKQLKGTEAQTDLLELTPDPGVRAFVLRALADRKPQNTTVPVEPFIEALEDENPRVRLEAVNGLARLNARSASEEIIPLTADPDRAVSEVAVNALANLGATEPCLAAVANGSAGEARGALEALYQMHTAQAVYGLTTQLKKTNEDSRRLQILTALGRLYHREAEWNGTDWWGTQPDIRGPYFEPVTWEESERIKPVLRQALIDENGSQLTKLAHALELNRALPDGSAELLAATAEAETTLKTELVDALVGQLTVPEDAVDVLEELSSNGSSLREDVLRLLVAQEQVPEEATDLLKESALDDQLNRELRMQIIDVLYRSSPQ